MRRAVPFKVTSLTVWVPLMAAKDLTRRVLAQGPDIRPGADGCGIPVSNERKVNRLVTRRFGSNFTPPPEIDRGVLYQLGRISRGDYRNATKSGCPQVSKASALSSLTTTPSSLVVSFRRVVDLDALRWTAAAVLIAFCLYRLAARHKPCA